MTDDTTEVPDPGEQPATARSGRLNRFRAVVDRRRVLATAVASTVVGAVGGAAIVLASGAGAEPNGHHGGRGPGEHSSVADRPSGAPGEH